MLLSSQGALILAATFDALRCTDAERYDAIETPTKATPTLASAALTWEQT